MRSIGGGDQGMEIARAAHSDTEHDATAARAAGTATLQRHFDVTTRYRIESGYASLRSHSQSAGRRQQGLEIEKVGDQWTIVAFDAKRSQLSQREYVVEIRRWQRLPEFVPSLTGAAHCKGPRFHDRGSAMNPNDASMFYGNEIGLGVDFDHYIDREIAPSSQQCLVAVHEISKLFNHGRKRGRRRSNLQSLSSQRFALRGVIQ